MKTVFNEWGTEINYDVAENMMDGELREMIHYELAPCTEQEFFDEYVKRHKEKFGEEWVFAEKNPCY